MAFFSPLGHSKRHFYAHWSHSNVCLLRTCNVTELLDINSIVFPSRAKSLVLILNVEKVLFEKYFLCVE